MSGDRIAAMCGGIGIMAVLIIGFYAFVARELGVRETLKCAGITAAGFAIIVVVAFLMTYASNGEWFA